MLDAMACGVPVVASRTGGIPEAVSDGVNGLLVLSGDDAALAKTLVALLRDPEARTRLGRAGRDRVVDEFDVDKMVAKTLRTYEERLRGR